jgi:hypothetical protein
MTPEEMTDEQLVEPKEIITSVEAGDGSWEVILSCGHELVLLGPPSMTSRGCSQCLDIFLERSKKHASPDR